MMKMHKVPNPVGTTSGDVDFSFRARFRFVYFFIDLFGEIKYEKPK